MGGHGIGLRPLWDVGPDVQSGALEIILPEWRATSHMAIYAVYPSRDFMPAKVNAFIDFLGETYGTEPYWDRAIAKAGLVPAPVITKSNPREISGKTALPENKSPLPSATLR